jgi:hypothetical protein
MIEQDLSFEARPIKILEECERGMRHRMQVCGRFFLLLVANGRALGKL